MSEVLALQEVDVEGEQLISDGQINSSFSIICNSTLSCGCGNTAAAGTGFIKI